MSVLKKLLHFIGGKPPQVIFKNGEVTHVHTEKKWQMWKDRFEKDLNYQFRQHSGMSGKHQKNK
ncbi:MAG: hypothetical protein AB7F59_10160 [Bdellovibrionales bacterium]